VSLFAISNPDSLPHHLLICVNGEADKPLFRPPVRQQHAPFSAADRKLRDSNGDTARYRQIRDKNKSGRAA
jgi:hypothetical protein